MEGEEIAEKESSKLLLLFAPSVVKEPVLSTGDDYFKPQSSPAKGFITV